jgi:hypothetical protein
MLISTMTSHWQSHVWHHSFCKPDPFNFLLQEAKDCINGYLWICIHGCLQSCNQFIDLRYTLRMMGIPLDGPSWMFGDNESVITSSTIPHCTLNNCHYAPSYHCVLECIAAQFSYLLHVSGKLNLTDMLKKTLVG